MCIRDRGVYDQDVYNNQKFQTDFWAITDGGSNKGTRLLYAWNTNNTGSSIPRLSTMNTADEGRASTYFVENGSYLKLRTLQDVYKRQMIISPLTSFFLSGIARSAWEKIMENTLELPYPTRAMAI